MKSFKNIISFLFVMLFVLIAPLKTEAITIEEVMEDMKTLQALNIEDIKKEVSYDYQESIEEIVSILNDSLDDSKTANLKLNDLNILMNLINDENAKLLSIEDKAEYDTLVASLKLNVEDAKGLNQLAKNYSQDGLTKYNKALELYASLKLNLEASKQEAETILNNNISLVNSKLDIINGFLEELEKLEESLKEAYEEATITYETAKQNAETANNNFSEKLEELKEYISVNGEDELNELIRVNTNYLTSGVLYATSQTALYLIDIEIGLVESEIASLESEKALLDNELVPYETILNTKKEELNVLNGELETLNTSLENINKEIQELQTTLNREIANKAKLESDLETKEEELAKCESYVDELKEEIKAGNTTNVIEIILTNHERFSNKNISVEVDQIPSFNVNLELVYFITVTDTDTNDTYKYTYEEDDGVVTINEYDYVAKGELTTNDIKGELSAGKYKVVYNNEEIDFVKMNISGNLFGLIQYDFTVNGFMDGGKYYEVYFDNGWKAIEQKISYTKKGTFNYDVYLTDNGSAFDIEVLVSEHYEPNGTTFTSTDVVNICDAIITDTIENAILEKTNLIAQINDNITTKNSEKETILSSILLKETAITDKNSEISEAEANLNNMKDTLVTESGMTYTELVAKIAELNKKLNGLPTSPEALEGVAQITGMILNAGNGNVDAQGIVETISSLDVGLNLKKGFIGQIDAILATMYNDAKQELIEVAGEDLENISNILKELVPLMGEVAETNLKLVEEKVKYEVSRVSYETLLEVKSLVLEGKEEVLAELEALETLKENNNTDFLKDLDEKIAETKVNLVEVTKEVEVTINEYVEPEKEETENKKPNSGSTTKPSDKDDNEEDNNGKDKEDNTNDSANEPDSGFDYWKLLWLLPIIIAIIVVIVILKKNNEK